MVADTPPVGEDPNTLWWNSSDGRLYIYYEDSTAAQWVEASPAADVDETLFVSAKHADHKEGDLTLGITESDVAIKLEVASGTIYAPNAIIEPIASERRLKENIVQLDAESSWETVRDLPYYEYNFIAIRPNSLSDQWPTKSQRKWLLSLRTVTKWDLFVPTTTRCYKAACSLHYKKLSKKLRS